MTLAKDHISVVCQHFERASPLKLLGKSHLNVIYMHLSGKMGKKVYTLGVGHKNKMPAMPIYGKNLKKTFFSKSPVKIALKLDM